MKFVRSGKKQMTFRLDKREKELLFQILRLYPLVPPSRHVLSKNGEGPEHDENQRLLEESLAEQRRENRRQVLAMLDEPGRFRETQEDFLFSLSLSETEWLLQVLNDVRVGAWLALGEPEEIRPADINKSNAHYILVMEGAGHFEWSMLEALGVRNPGETDED